MHVFMTRLGTWGLISSPGLQFLPTEVIKLRKYIYRVRHLTFFFQLVLMSWIVALSSCLIWQIISFILPPNEYSCVCAWTMLGNIPILLFTILAKKKNHLFRWSSFWSWRVCKQAKLFIEKPTHPKRGIIGTFFFENEQGEAAALKDNIREAIAEIQLHTIDNVDRLCRLPNGQPRQSFEWNYFPLLIGRIVLLNKKKETKLRKYSVVFFF